MLKNNENINKLYIYVGMRDKHINKHQFLTHVQKMSTNGYDECIRHREYRRDHYADDICPEILEKHRLKRLKYIRKTKK